MVVALGYFPSRSRATESEPVLQTVPDLDNDVNPAALGREPLYQMRSVLY